MISSRQAAVMHVVLETQNPTRCSVAAMAPGVAPDPGFDALVAQAVITDLLSFRCLETDWKDPRSLAVTPRGRQELREFGQRLQTLVTASVCR
jgi:hypothetical protein